MSSEPMTAGGMVIRPIVTEPERFRRFRSLRFLTYAFIVAALANVTAMLFEAAALIGQWRLLAALGRLTPADRLPMRMAARASDVFVNASVAAVLLTMLVCYVLGAIWVYNAACNARAIGARGLQVSPGWAVGWWIVPIASWFKPFQAVEEIYRASAAPLGWQRLKTPALLRWWWAAWLIGEIAGGGLNAIRDDVHNVPGLIVTTEARLALVFLAIACAGLFLTIVWRTYRAQLTNRDIAGQVAEVFA